MVTQNYIPYSYRHVRSLETPIAWFTGFQGLALVLIAVFCIAMNLSEQLAKFCLKCGKVPFG
ncbi:hypothetical protein, partial [Neobacillus fumarioli]|uniref:hypothetical protein n=1 Tax=Neobacillus fumarioli TaxID=105229 RepID=UPI001C3F3FE8